MELEKELYDTTLTHEFSFNGLMVKGLGIAYLLGGIGVSLNREKHWDNSKIILRTTYYDAEIDDLLSEDITVNHASTLTNLKDHEDWFLKDRMIDIVDSSELWSKREKLFSKLEFCDSVYDWLKKCDYGNPLFHQIINRLVELNYYFDAWNEGPFDPEAIPSKCSPESKVTLEQFEKDHTFISSNGDKNLYSWHVRVTPGAWRIFFLADEQTRKGKIGYIGPKLPTVKCH